MNASWGLLGSERLPNTRRTRTLGVAASVRSFNDLAVPGLGGVWYGKQVLLATLGVAVAERARRNGAKVQNIEVANAIEALACRLAFESNQWSRDARLRGITKLQTKDDFSFRRARQRNFYVTQPMRMATVQTLPALGLVESASARFNAFRCSPEGSSFVERATEEFHPKNRTVLEGLALWVEGRDDRIETDALKKALSPILPLSKIAVEILRERLIQGGKEAFEDKKRRSRAMAWVEMLRQSKPISLSWEFRPSEISQEHWDDLQAGALFSKTRDAAIAVLDAVEAQGGTMSVGGSVLLNRTIPELLNPSFTVLKNLARQFLDFSHADEEANAFCRECTMDDPSRILRSLVNRDGQVLRLVGDEIKPGPAFRGSAKPMGVDEDDQEAPQQGRLPFPEGISNRLQNLYLLNRDLHGELEEWLSSDAGGE